ncbi:hypothetical protein BJV77DRAFT_978501 [Russula vinacea]|nr:hypothetical protein BJV77DRAFT_978501 [Russula vinacea]
MTSALLFQRQYSIQTSQTRRRGQLMILLQPLYNLRTKHSIIWTSYSRDLQIRNVFRMFWWINFPLRLH